MGNWLTNLWDSVRGARKEESRSLGDYNLPLTDQETLRALGMSHIKVNVNARNAMSIPTFFGCVRVISDLVSSTPFGVYRELKGGGSTRDRGHSLDYALSVEANQFMVPVVAIKTIVANVKVYGHSVSRILRDVSGNVTGFYPYPTAHVAVLEDDITGLLFFQITDRGNVFYLSHDDVLYIKDTMFDGKMGCSILEWQSKTIKLSLLTSGFLEKYYEKGTFVAGFLEQPSINLNDPEIVKKYKKNVIDTLKNDENGFGMAIIGAGGKWHPVARSPVESQLMETFNKSDKDIVKLFGVNLTLVGDAEKQTSWGSGVEQMFIGVTRAVLIPLATQIEQEFNRKCFRRTEIKKGYYTKFNFWALLRGDSEAYGTFVRTMVGIGAYSLDEVRALDEKPPIEGGFGKRHYIQGANVPIDKMDDIIDNKNSKRNGARQTLHPTDN